MDPLLAPQDLRRLPRPFILLDARPLAAFTSGHLPGARHTDPETVLSAAAEPGHDPARGGRHPLPAPAAWSRKLGELGIAPGVPVVLYDAAGGGNAAARGWWMLRASGHPDCAVLDGGLQAALADGFELTEQVEAFAPWPPYPCTEWRLPLASLEEVAERVGQASWKVLDVRSAERWRGETEPYDPVSGRIPGAGNLPYLENLDAAGRFKSAAELRAMYLRFLDGLSPERLMVHCGSGVTACHTLLALEVAGLPGAALYVGSWSEWCRSGRDIRRG
jgi:thiosulfate/3-mercaptopyruvate sulfurtransferase